LVEPELAGSTRPVLIRYLHEQAFDAHPQVKGLLVDGERAALEADFVGRHASEFAGKPATGKDIRVPYSVVYDLQGDQITALRIYLAMDEIVRQLEA
jgi:predicted ester cyclase